MYEVLDWSKLPTALAYLAVPAEKYGRYQFEDQIFDFLRGMSNDETVELTALLRRTMNDGPAIESWLDQHRITEHREAALIYFMGHLLALANDAGFFPERGGD